MIKDVKSYIHTVGSRLTKAFSMEAFGTEEQLQFWELSAEHFSRKSTPNFGDIVSWIDLLYKAPVHFVYKLTDNKLILDRRHVITNNILETERDKSPHEETPQEKEYIRNFEHQLQNLEKKMEMDEIFLEQGIASHSIGQCEHIPLYTEDGTFWGIYCVGPYTKSPEQITPKLSIVGRILARWLISLDEQESNPQSDYKKKVESVIKDLGSGKLNTKGLAEIILRYVVNERQAQKGFLAEFTNSGHAMLASVGFEDDASDKLSSSGGNTIYQIADEELTLTDHGKNVFEELNFTPEVHYFEGTHHAGFLVLNANESSTNVNTETNILLEALANLLDYRFSNVEFSGQLMDTFYQMQRSIEKSRKKTAFHTPRMMAFVQRFGMLFGLEDDEMELITQTAKLHDIGYVGALSVEPGKTIGGEIEHPLIGANLIENLAVHEDVVEGIRTHHEWVNGNGTPHGLKSDDIPWTGKIIAVFEYVVDFIESNHDDSSKTDEEWIEQLSKGLMERADVEFDMVIIPTAIQLIQAMGWEQCVALGAE